MRIALNFHLFSNSSCSRHALKLTHEKFYYDSTDLKRVCYFLIAFSLFLFSRMPHYHQKLQNSTNRSTNTKQISWKIHSAAQTTLDQEVQSRHFDRRSMESEFIYDLQWILHRGKYWFSHVTTPPIYFTCFTSKIFYTNYLFIFISLPLLKKEMSFLTAPYSYLINVHFSRSQNKFLLFNNFENSFQPSIYF